MVTCFRLRIYKSGWDPELSREQENKFKQSILEKLDRNNVFDVEITHPKNNTFFAVTLSHLYSCYDFPSILKNALKDAFDDALAPDGFELDPTPSNDSLWPIAHWESDKGEKSYYAIDCRPDNGDKEYNYLSLGCRYRNDDMDKESNGPGSAKMELAGLINNWIPSLYKKSSDEKAHRYSSQDNKKAFFNLYKDRKNGGDLVNVATKVCYELKLTNKLVSVFAVKKKSIDEEINNDLFNEMSELSIDVESSSDTAYYETSLLAKEDNTTTRLWWVSEALKIGGIAHWEVEGKMPEFMPWFNNSVCILKAKNIESEESCKKLFQYVAGNILAIDTTDPQLLEKITKYEQFVERFQSASRQTAVILLYSEDTSKEYFEKCLDNPNWKDTPLETIQECLNISEKNLVKVNTYTPLTTYLEACGIVEPTLKKIWMELKGDNFDESFEKDLNNFAKKRERNGDTYNRTDIIRDFRLYCDNKFYEFCRANCNDIENYSALFWEGTPDGSEYDSSKDWLKELNSFIGLDGVKKQINKLIHLVEYRAKRDCLDTSTSRLVFTFEGDPGCGKSSIAKLFACCMKQVGILDSKQPFVKVSVGELVGTHVGEAANYVNAMFKKNMGSLIFIDEAYTLLDNDSYGRSAISAIIDNISTMTRNTILVLAGYPKDIQRLLKANPGFESRITEHIHFDNYSSKELFEILDHNLKVRLRLEFKGDDKEKIQEAICAFFTEASSCNSDDAGKSLGNARFVDNLMLRIESEQASYCAKLKALNNQNVPDSTLYCISYDNIIAPLLKELHDELETKGCILGSRFPSHFQRLTDADKFDNIIGNKEAKKRLQNVIEDWKENQKKGKEEGKKNIPRGILLSGAPGCGKTSLAKAFARESGTACFMLGASELLKGYVGQSREAAEELFSEIEGFTNCTLFLDEIDLIGVSREGNSTSSSEEVLHVLLNHLDGIATNRENNLFVIAATNYPGLLDPALKRRLGLEIIVTLPNQEERLELINRCLYYTDKRIAIDVPSAAREEITLYLDGESYDTIIQVIKIAEQEALHKEYPKINAELLHEAVDIKLLGNRSSVKLQEDETRRVAIHELGHILIALKNGNPASAASISLAPRASGALGVTKTIPANPKTLLTRADIENQITQLLAGRGAEEVFYGSDNISTGCGDDLPKANELCRQVLLYTSPNLHLRKDNDPTEQKEEEELLKACYERAKTLISADKDKLEKCVDILIKETTISGIDVERILKEA